MPNFHIKDQVQPGDFPIIPDSVGYGMQTTACCRTGDPIQVYWVENLNDSGLGSLRYGLEDLDGPNKFIGFKVSGTIHLESSIRVGGFTGQESEKGTNVWIAGQTAPGTGINIADEGINWERNCSDVLIQHIRFRTGLKYQAQVLGSDWVADGGAYYNEKLLSVTNVNYNGTNLTPNDGATNTVALNEFDFDSGRLYVNVGEDPSLGTLVACPSKSATPDAFVFNGKFRDDVEPNWTPMFNVVLDHCSIAWGGDIQILVQANYITIQNCIVMECLDNIYHVKSNFWTGGGGIGHSKGILCKSDHGDLNSNPVLIRNCYFLRNEDRNPRMSGTYGIIANCWSQDYDQGLNLDDSGSEEGDDSDSPTVVDILSCVHCSNSGSGPYVTLGDNANSSVYMNSDCAFVNTNIPFTRWPQRWYVENRTGNTLETRERYTLPATDMAKSFRSESPHFNIPGLILLRSEDLKDWLIANVGARPWSRDSVDTRAINELINGTLDVAVPQDEADLEGIEDIASTTTDHSDFPADPDTLESNGRTKLENWVWALTENL